MIHLRKFSSLLLIRNIIELKYEITTTNNSINVDAARRICLLLLLFLNPFLRCLFPTNNIKMESSPPQKSYQAVAFHPEDHNIKNLHFSMSLQTLKEVSCKSESCVSHADKPASMTSPFIEDLLKHFNLLNQCQDSSLSRAVSRQSQPFHANSSIPLTKETCAAVTDKNNQCEPNAVHKNNNFSDPLAGFESISSINCSASDESNLISVTCPV